MFDMYHYISSHMPNDDVVNIMCVVDILKFAMWQLLCATSGVMVCDLYVWEQIQSVGYDCLWQYITYISIKSMVMF